MNAQPEARTAIAAIQRHEAWAVIRLQESPTVTLVGGRRIAVDRILDLPLEGGVPAPGAVSTGWWRSRSGR